MKRLLLISAVTLALCLTGWTEPWMGQLVTVNAGTAVRLTVRNPTLATSLFAQMLPASSGGVGYILYAPKSVSCSNGGAGTTLVATLAPATATAPGGNAVIPFPADPQNPSINVADYCFDGSHTGDTMTVSWNLRN